MDRIIGWMAATVSRFAPHGVLPHAAASIQLRKIKTRLLILTGCPTRFPACDPTQE